MLSLGFEGIEPARLLTNHCWFEYIDSSKPKKRKRSFTFSDTDEDSIDQAFKYRLIQKMGSIGSPEQQRSFFDSHEFSGLHNFFDSMIRTFTQAKFLEILWKVIEHLQSPDQIKQVSFL